MRYVALLRAVNVGGKVVKMAELRKAFEKLGCTDVRTYLQSGNVVFGGKKPADLEKKLGLGARVLLMSEKEWAAVVKASPFKKEAADPTKVHVSFLFEAPGKEGLAKLAAVKSGKDRYAIKGRTVHLHCPDGYGRSKLANPSLERALGVPATTRNWRTIEALAALLAGEEPA